MFHARAGLWLSWAMPGDSVRSSPRDIQGLEGSFHVRSISPADGEQLKGARELRITFDEELPADYTPGRWTDQHGRTHPHAERELLPQPCVRHNRARGILINTPPAPSSSRTTPSTTLSGSAILFSTDNNMWYESGQTREVTIRRNLFQDVLTSLYHHQRSHQHPPHHPRARLQRHPFYGQGPKSIRIEDNIFRTFDTPPVTPCTPSAPTASCGGNKIEPTTSYPKFHPNQKRFLPRGCRNIDIEGSDLIE